jgi:hypothetical protein
VKVMLVLSVLVSKGQALFDDGANP